MMHRGEKGYHRSTLVIALLTALVALGILIWGSSQGTPLITSPQGTWGPPPLEPPEVVDQVPEIPLPGPQEEPVQDDRLTNWLLDLITALFAVIVLATVLLVLRAALNRQRLERETRRAADDDEELIALLDASGEDVRYRALSEGDPRNGVVACWVALEQAVHASGLREDLSETAAELTARVLGRWQVDATAITDLSQAYREARFSRHPVTEEQRRRAVAALERIHADLQARVAAEAEPQ